MVAAAAAGPGTVCPVPEDIDVRRALDADADGLIELIAGCWAEYPGTVMDVDGELPHLRAVDSAFRALGELAWVAAAGGQVVGSVGLVPITGADAAELRMLYVRAAARRSGLGGRLLAVAEDEARRRGARRIQLWSDTRFTTAPPLLRAARLPARPATRELHDLSASVEYFFSKDLQERQANRESASPARPSTSPP